MSSLTRRLPSSTIQLIQEKYDSGYKYVKQLPPQKLGLITLVCAFVVANLSFYIECMLNLTTAVLGLFYPAFKTYRAIEQKTNMIDRWSKYWVVWALFSALLVIW